MSRNPNIKVLDRYICICETSLDKLVKKMNDNDIYDFSEPIYNEGVYEVVGTLSKRKPKWVNKGFL